MFHLSLQPKINFDAIPGLEVTYHDANGWAAYDLAVREWDFQSEVAPAPFWPEDRDDAYFHSGGAAIYPPNPGVPTCLNPGQNSRPSA